MRISLIIALALLSLQAVAGKHQVMKTSTSLRGGVAESIAFTNGYETAGIFKQLMVVHSGSATVTSSVYVMNGSVSRTLATCVVTGTTPTVTASSTTPMFSEKVKFGVNGSNAVDSSVTWHLIYEE